MINLSHEYRYSILEQRTLFSVQLSCEGLMYIRFYGLLSASRISQIIKSLGVSARGQKKRTVNGREETISVVGICHCIVLCIGHSVQLPILLGGWIEGVVSVCSRLTCSICDNLG